MIVGVLAFHGDFAEHIEVLRSLHADCLEVRSLDDLRKVDRLILPGGESTVMSKFLWESGVGEEIIRRAHAGMPIYGTCAGAILLAKNVTGKHPPKTLGLMDITVERNAYGAQVDSFETRLTVTGIEKTVSVSFIRAPKITRTGKDVEVLASHDGIPVLVRQGKLLAGTFHPEVRGNAVIHGIFLAS